jgi:hypothetical protein
VIYPKQPLRFVRAGYRLLRQLGKVLPTARVYLLRDQGRDPGLQRSHSGAMRPSPTGYSTPIAIESTLSSKLGRSSRKTLRAPSPYRGSRVAALFHERRCGRELRSSRKPEYASGESRP